MTSLALALAACGGGGEGAVVEGTFAPGIAPTGVWVVESERGERADSAGFRIADLTPGPASLRLLDGSDTAAVLNLSGLGDGTRVRLEGLRVDRSSGFAFPRAVHLEGVDVVVVNGLRMAPAGRVPRAVDVRGGVLGWSPGTGALLLRPEDARLPDLRVFVGAATEVVGEDGGGADADAIRAGDSVRVEGRFEEGYVIATKLTLPTRIAGPADGADEEPAVAAASPEPQDEGDGGGGSGGDSGNAGDSGDGDRAAAAARPASAPAPVVRREGRGRGGDDPGRGRGRGRDKERGGGGGGGKGGGKGKG